MSPVRRLLPIKGRKSGDDDRSPGGGDDPKQPPNEEVPQESSEEEEESSDASESESEASSDKEDEDEEDEDDPMSWSKPTLCRSLNFAEKQFNNLKKRFQRCLDQIEKLTTDATNLKVKHQVAIASKNTTISNIRNQLKAQAETKAAVRQVYENKYREEIDSLKSQLSSQRKRSNELARNVAKSEKEAKAFCTEKDIVRRRLSTVNLNYVEKVNQLAEFKKENKRLKKEVEKKTAALERIDETKLEAQVQIEKEKTERKKAELAEKTARKLMEQQMKDIEYQKKKELAEHNSELRIQEKAKVRLKKDEEDKAKLQEQKNQMDSHLVTLHRSAATTRTLPNNGEFHGANQFIRLLQQQLQPPTTPANDLSSMLLRLGSASGSTSGSGNSNDDAISLVTQPPTAAMSPPAPRQLTLTQMERESTPRQTLP